MQSQVRWEIKRWLTYKVDVEDSSEWDGPRSSQSKENDKVSSLHLVPARCADVYYEGQLLPAPSFGKPSSAPGILQRLKKHLVEEIVHAACVSSAAEGWVQNAAV